MPIFDLSYRPWEGEADRGSRAWPIFRESLAFAFRTKWLKLLYAGAWAPALIASVFRFIQYTILATEEGARGMAHFIPPSMEQEFFFGFQTSQFFIMCMLVAFVGPGLVAEDRKANALELYLSRPITRRDYVLGKAGALIAFLMSVTFAPLFTMWLADGLMAPSVDRFAATIVYPFRALYLNLLLSTGTAFLVMGISSMTRSGAMGMIYWFAAFFTSNLAAGILYLITKRQAFTLLGFSQLFESLGRATYELGPKASLPAWPAALTVFCLLSALALALFVRRLRGSEVFS